MLLRRKVQVRGKEIIIKYFYNIFKHTHTRVDFARRGIDTLDFRYFCALKVFPQFTIESLYSDRLPIDRERL